MDISFYVLLLIFITLVLLYFILFKVVYFMASNCYFHTYQSVYSLYIYDCLRF